MHEMGIATSVLDAAQNEAKRHPGSKLLKVGLRVGEWSGVDPDSLRFFFGSSEEIVGGVRFGQLAK
jgi:hydrogenase nickel incorporation protein HypA/HybF